MADRRQLSLACLRGRQDAMRAVRRVPTFADAHVVRRDGWDGLTPETAESVAAGLLLDLASELAAAGIHPEIAKAPRIPPCTITYGTNEFGTLETAFNFEGDASPITTTPAVPLTDITNDYVIGLYAWSRNPRDELTGANGEPLPTCPGMDADEGMPRMDVKPNAAAIMLPIPRELAASFPDNGKSMPPHVTMLYVPDLDPARVDELALIVADAVGVRYAPIGRETDGLTVEGGMSYLPGLPDLALAGLRYFDNDGFRVAVASVAAPPELFDLHRTLAARLERVGIETGRKGKTWVPHATLAYLEPDQVYTGPMPTGTWKVGTIEVWRGDDLRYVIGHGSVSGVDKYERQGSRWVAFRDAGRRRVGDFATEAEAREGLAADDVDRRLTGRYDKGGAVTLTMGATSVSIAPDGKVKIAAPAVHTESRVHTFDAIRADRIELQTEHKPVYHPDGWVLYPVLYSRGGNIQEYDGVREYRPKSEVFSRASMDSGIGNPWELRHSRDLLNPDTVSGVARGCIVSVDVHSDNEHTFGWAKAWDRRLLYAIEGVDGQRPEAPEVSVAYRGRIHRQPGHDDFGKPFDQWISDMVWNSLASEPYGRAETARVLTGRADASDGITIASADEMLALARGSRMPTRPVYYDLSPNSWTRFDSARSPTPKQDTVTVTNKAIIKAAQALGVADEAIIKVLGISAEDLTSLLGSDTELTPDQVNAMISLLPAEPKVAASPPAQAPVEKVADEAKMVPLMIGEAELSVTEPVAKAVTEFVKMLEGKASEAEDKADRAGKRADKAETALSTAERELTKRADAMSTMVTRADAEAMVESRATRLASAIELVRMGLGPDGLPEARKDSATGDALPLSLGDWERAAIRVAFTEIGDAANGTATSTVKADAILKRIDAAPTAEARDYAMQERLADARERLSHRHDKHDDAVASVNRMRASNAEIDRKDGKSEDRLAQANQQQRHYAEHGYVGAPTQSPAGAGA